MNTITIEGRLTRDAELRYTPSGMALTNLDVASNHGKKDEATGKRQVTFFSAVCFGQIAEGAANLPKGASVVLIGKVTQDTWQDKETGANRSKLKVIANTVAIPIWGEKKAERTLTPPLAQAPSELQTEFSPANSLEKELEGII